MPPRTNTAKVYLSDLPKYFNDYVRYRRYCRQLVWYQKYKGLRWIYGQNLGDYLSTVVTAKAAICCGVNLRHTETDKRLLSIGSILHFARDNDVVWGAGVNGKIDPSRHRFHRLDVRMVRGPMTKEFLQSKGITVPEVFGDPALLIVSDNSYPPPACGPRARGEFVSAVPQRRRECRGEFLRGEIPGMISDN